MLVGELVGSLLLPRTILIGLIEIAFRSMILFVSFSLSLLFYIQHSHSCVNVIITTYYVSTCLTFILQDFKYPKGKDSVLEVNEEEYKACNTTHPITSLTDGDSLYVLSRSGPFFFVSGNSENCLKGQKLPVKVMSTAHHGHSPRQPSPSPSPSPSPTLSPSHHDLSSPAPSPKVVLSETEALAPAPGPAKAHNSAGLVSPRAVSLGLVLVVIISFMV